jgi:hypothetical protein
MPASLDRTVAVLAEQLAAHRPLMLAALFRADQLPTAVPGLAGRAAGDPVDGCIGTCWMAEAMWGALHSPLTDPDYAIGDRELLLPLAARCRFLALSEPLRWRGIRPSPWLSAPDDEADDPVSRVFGTDSWNILVGRCREARRAWVEYLDAYQSQVYLSQARPEELEKDLRAVVFRQPYGRPLGVSIQGLAGEAPLTAEDSALVADITDRHLLPRFDVLHAAALAGHDDRRGSGLARWAIGLLAVLAGAGAVVCAALLLIYPAAWAGAACYAVIGLGTAVFGPRWSAPWLLRFPAAASVGVIALISLSPGGWISSPPGGWRAVLALAAASFGYLVVEVRNHGVGGWALLRRSLGVAAIGVVHALMVSLIGLVAIAPAFVQNGQAITGLWHWPSYAQAGMALALATAWCLTVGVFSQILWDDRPITAPLAHLSWRAR